MTRTIIALMLTTAFALTACNNNAATADNNLAATDDLNAMTNTGAADMNGTAASVNLSADDQSFLTDAMKGDNSEVALGQLAQQKGASQGVKDFGNMLATDHGQAKQQVAALAQQGGMTVTDDMMDAAKTEQQKLQGLSGAAFDKEFATYMVSDHKKDIAKFEQQAKGTGPVAQLAQQTLPTLRKHLGMAESLAK